MIIWFLVFHFVIFRVYLTFVEAVILVLKHATFIHLSKSGLNLDIKSSLAHADVHYEEANIDMKIQEFLKTSQAPSVMQFVDFIMATEIGLFIFTSVKLISHQVCAEYPQYFIKFVQNMWPRVRDILVPPQSKHMCRIKIVGLHSFES